MHEIPSLFVYNQICVMSDMSTSKAGTITSGENRYMEWKTKDGSYENTQYAQFDTFFEGLFDKARFLDILRNFICLMWTAKIPLRFSRLIINISRSKRRLNPQKRQPSQTARAVCSGIRRAAVSRCLWSFTLIICNPRSRARRSSSLPTATNTRSSATVNSPAAVTFCGKPRFRLKPDSI